jgi:chromosome segregation ATPase
MLSYNFTIQKKISILILTAVLLWGCDPNAKEKRTLRLEIKNIKSELNGQLEIKSSMDKEIQNIKNDIESNRLNNSEMLSELEGYKSRLTSLKAQKAYKEIRKAKLQYDMGRYIMDYPWATLSIIAAGGGLAATLEENMDEDTKNFLQGMGIVGAIYCIFNASECGRVTTKLFSFDSDLTDIKNEISSLNSSIYDYEREIGPLNEKYERYQVRLKDLRSKLSQQKEKDNSLVIAGLETKLQEIQESLASL